MQYSLPPGFVDYDNGRLRLVAPRLEIEEMLSLFEARADKKTRIPVATGRGGTFRTTLAGGQTVYVRKCLRGGAMRWLSRDLYLLRPARPVRELVVSETARARGCRVPAILAVAVQDVGPFYRGWVVSEAVPAARGLIDEISQSDAERSRCLLRAAAGAIGSLHRAGVYHVDLTGDNLLVDELEQVWIIDFDRAYIGAPEQPRQVQRGLERLCRSLTKAARARRLSITGDFRDVLFSAYSESVGEQSNESAWAPAEGVRR